MNLENIKLKNFTELDYSEKIMVLSWRNNESVRKWMYNSEIISADNHLNFITSLKSKKDNIYFLVEENDKQLGVIYFNKIDYEYKTCYFGLYANPFEKVSGVGRILEEISIKYVFEILKFDTLKLEVFDENVQVKNLHRKYKFKEVGKKIIDNKNVICMELRK